MSIAEIAASAKSASIRLAAVKTDVKNKALAEIATALKRGGEKIVSANKKDLADAEKNIEQGISNIEQGISNVEGRFLAWVGMTEEISNPSGPDLDGIEQGISK